MTRSVVRFVSTLFVLGVFACSLSGCDLFESEDSGGGRSGPGDGDQAVVRVDVTPPRI